MNESDLKKFRLGASVGSARGRILAAALSARRDWAVGRWILRAALASIALAAFVSTLGGRSTAVAGPEAPRSLGHIGSIPPFEWEQSARPDFARFGHVFQEGSTWRR